MGYVGGGIEGETYSYRVGRDLLIVVDVIGGSESLWDGSASSLTLCSKRVGASLDVSRHLLRHSHLLQNQTFVSTSSGLNLLQHHKTRS